MNTPTDTDTGTRTHTRTHTDTDTDTDTEMFPYALPPAESRLPLSSVLRGFAPGQSDFAASLASFLGAESCILAGSARALLSLLFRELSSASEPTRDQILIPGYTCYSLPAAAVKAGLKVSLYDLDPHTFQPDLEDVRNKISGRTLAVVGQHLLSVPVDMDSLARLAAEHGAVCIDDSAQLLPGRHSSADYTVYSFGRGKPLPLGRGGALVCNGFEPDSLLRAVQALPQGTRSCLMPLAVQVLSRPWLYWSLEKLPLGLGRTIYDPGFKVRAMPRAYQRMGVFALDSLDMINSHRSFISQTYARRLDLDFDSGPGDQAWPHVRYPVLVDNQDGVDDVAHLGLRRMYPQALCDLEALKPELVDPNVQNPGARHIARTLVTLPTHLGVDENQAQKIAAEAQKAFGNMRIIKT